MATYSKKMMGKEVGQANVYAKPHTMKGKAVTVEAQPGRGPVRNSSDTVDMSVGNIDKSKGEHAAKTTGIKIRGTGVPPRAPWPVAPWREV